MPPPHGVWGIKANIVGSPDFLVMSSELELRNSSIPGTLLLFECGVAVIKCI